MPRLPSTILKRAGMGTHCIHTLNTAISFCAKGSLTNKNKNFGEDAAVSATWSAPGKLRGASLVAVADGVGGWKRHGVDPSFLSQGLLREIARLFKEQERGSGLAPSLGLLTSAFASLCKAGEQYAGGTTVCMAQFNPATVELEVLNLGDSGAILIRDNEVVERTVPDVDGMTPRQLTILPSWMSVTEGGPDLEPHAQTQLNSISSWQLQPRDILILASDGYFDNVSSQETLAVLKETQTAEPDAWAPEKLADNLLTRAYYNSLNPLLASPFALRLLQESDGTDDYWGGKPDDISLVVCIVEEQDLSSRL